MIGPDGLFTRYVGRLFAVRFIGFLMFFVILLQMLDLLNESKAINAAEGAGFSSIVNYVSLRAPQIASQFAPFAALLAIVVTLATLNLTSEITIMRAAGMSIHRVLAPIGIVCGAIALCHFVFHELVVVKATEKLAYWVANDYALDLPDDLGTRTDVRLAHDNALISAQSAVRSTEKIQLNGVVIYNRNENGLTESIIEARSAVFAEGTWRLVGLTRLDASNLGVAREATALWDTTLDPELLFAMTLNADRTSLPGLLRQIGKLQSDGADSSAAMTSLLSRFSRPMSTLVMPLLGAVAGFGVRRQGNQLVRAVGGAGLGFIYFVAENLMLAIGKLGVAPAMLSAFLPFALFMVIGFTILLSMEN